MNPDRPFPDPDPEGNALRSRISAAADGDGDALDRACIDWRQSSLAREAWHSYHLIGDAMRSRELATSPARDEAFLQALRARLQAEPVVLAPTAVTTKAAPRWWAPAAAAAGVVAVAGVLVVSRLAAPEAAGTLSAAAPPASAVAPSAADAQLIRDARLDDYLQAHQAVRGGVGAAVPGSALRRVDLDLPAGAGK